MALAVSKAEREVQGSESGNGFLSRRSRRSVVQYRRQQAIRDWCISYSNTACDVLAVHYASRVHTGYKAQSPRLVCIITFSKQVFVDDPPSTVFKTDPWP